MPATTVIIVDTTRIIGGTSGHHLKIGSSGVVESEAASGGGAPTDATYLTNSANGSLSAEVVVSALGVNLSIKGNDAAGRTITLGQQVTNADTVNIDVPNANAQVGGVAIVTVSATQTLTNKSISTSQIDSGTFADARIAESNVTQHQGAIKLDNLGTPDDNTDLDATGSLHGLMPKADKTKVDYLTVTQAVDLDAIETRVNALDAAVILQGSWDASVGTFPGGGTAQAGDSYIVSTGGTVDSVVFTANDRIVAITDNASTSTYASNWLKLDYTDQVVSVAGKTGTVTLDADDVSEVTDKRYMTDAQETKLDSVESSADVTDATNVSAAGAVMADGTGNDITGDLVFTEKSDHSSTPSASKGYLWVKDTTPSTLIFTDDTGVDTTMGSSDNLGDHTATQDVAMAGFDLNDVGVIYLNERAAAEADTAGDGQIWVKTATPNELWFTDDAGSDFQVAYRENDLSVFAATTSAQLAGVLSDETGTGSVVFGTNPAIETPTLTGDIVFNERADHASTPGAGKGYLWVKNTAPSTLFFTDDAGTDTDLTAGGGAPTGAQYVTLATDGDLTNERVLTGTANQITVTDNGAGSTVVLSTPQNLHTGASPTFTGGTFTGDLTVQGKIIHTGDPILVDAEHVSVRANYTYQNVDYTTVSAQTGGIVLNYLPTSTSTTTSGAGVFTAGSPSTLDPSVTTSGSGTFSIGDIIQISGSNNNDGIYEVSDHTFNNLSIRSTNAGMNARVEDFTLDDWDTAETDTGATITKINVTVLRSGTDGVWETGSGATTGITYSNVVTLGTTDVSSASWVLDEDDFASNSATKVPTQQSTKAYIESAAIATVGGRLSLETGVSVSTSDQSAKTTLYYAIHSHDRIGLYNTSEAQWEFFTFTEASLATSGFTASKPHDIFAYDNSGTLTLEAVAWTNDTTRATSLATQDSVYVKSGSANKRYVGTVYVDGSKQLNVTGTDCDIWNAYNRVENSLLRQESTASWTYTTATFRQANADTDNQVNIVRGLDEDSILVQCSCGSANTTGAVLRAAGVGLNSTSTDSSQLRSPLQNANDNIAFNFAFYTGLPGIGRVEIVWLEWSQASGTSTFHGVNASWQLQSGIFARFQY